LKSVASATAAPASTSARAGGIGRPSTSAATGRSTPTTSLSASARDAVVAGRLEVVDGARAEVDRERDRALLGELVAVQPQREACASARLEVPARLVAIERAALEKDVRRLGEPGRLRENLGECEVEGTRRHRRIRAAPRARRARSESRPRP
jgi:hypothetical protein